MADPNKLNPQFDLNNIDIEQIIRGVSEHQNTIIKIALIIGSLIALGMMYNDYHIKAQGLHAQLSQEQQKLDAIKVHDAAAQALNSFTSSLPKKLDEFGLITLISDDAKSYNISIPSLSPADNKDMGLYDVTDFDFNAVSDNFKDMMLFLNKIEKSEIHLRVDSWTGNEDASGNGAINFVIKISAVHLHT